MTSINTDTASQLLTHLESWGFSAGVQQRIGAFGVVWTVFESQLEPLVWRLRKETVVGERPSTDKQTISEWIKQLSASAPSFEGEVQSLLKDAALAAEDLMAYRHALFHGWLLSFHGLPIFVRNPRWNQENRKRPTDTAHINEALLNLALTCAWVLCRFLEEFVKLLDGTVSPTELRVLSHELKMARRDANKLRHHTPNSN